MITDDLRKMRDQEPFVPFRIWLSDGTTNFLVSDVRDLILTRAGTIALRDECDELQILNHIQVARLSQERSQSPRGKGAAKGR